MTLKMQMSLGLKGAMSVFPLLTFAVAIVWLVYVSKYQDKGPDPDRDGSTNVEKYTICYQGLVATVLLYFIFKHHAELMFD